ncbi:hypothetical protein ACFQ77_34690 [Streptomyces virginiae]|uniref:hypothetical protein n=1 Tax=Streptomyces virginiae TaxID=1961 RepID=UPI003687ABAE
MAERFGDTVRLTVNGEQSDSPVIELSVTELRTLLDAAERDLTGFFALATGWIAQHLPGHRAPVTAALARALGLAAPTATPQPRATEPRFARQGTGRDRSPLGESGQGSVRPVPVSP